MIVAVNRTLDNNPEGMTEFFSPFQGSLFYMTRVYNRFTPSGLIITMAEYGVMVIKMLKVENLPVASTGLG